eukprot:TRINITY_DN1224_c0_g5_i1.p1 TRINITY_DN1224_c0_g5~~TRINITY_DN1224_c0_g5_i1.p1  ORF type:complete len:644 (+),score=17.01 TRINITY_DN1224_c0_g5_i1:53-1984(+)
MSRESTTNSRISHSTFLETLPLKNCCLSLLKLITLGLICALAFACRTFSVARYESVMHEFDPWFNYRAAQFLSKEGLYCFFNWFDSESWYPLGRNIGSTIYPGLMSTTVFIHRICRFLYIPIDVKTLCVFMGPIFSSLTSFATYLLAKEITRKSSTGLFAAFFISIVPAYVSRSVAGTVTLCIGSYDNEAVAICALIAVIYLYLKAANSGSIGWTVACSFAYFYMAASWGGYVFLTNLIPLYTFGLLCIGKLNKRVYTSYSIFYVLGTLLIIQLPTVGFLAIKSAEHLLSHGVFITLQIHFLANYLASLLPNKTLPNSKPLILAIFAILLICASKMKWSGRNLSLLNPLHAFKDNPIVTAVAEHQSTPWSSYFLSFHILLLLMPVGFFICCKGKAKANYGKLLIALYAVLSIYFCGLMSRLVIVAAPAVCVMAAMAVSKLLRAFSKNLFTGSKVDFDLSLFVTAILGLSCYFYLIHSTWAAAEAYSAPSIVISGSNQQGQRVTVDDFREAYRWLSLNTNSNAKVLAWWDYGYQIATLSNRTVIVDGNTWNATHIGLVGKAMASDEATAHRVCRALGADYVLVVFGAVTGYSDDDLNKLVWMARIASSFFPDIDASDYKDTTVYFRKIVDGRHDEFIDVQAELL